MRLGDLLHQLEEWYDPAWAEPRDRVGLVCGDPDAEIRRVLAAVDPVGAVVDEALDWGADLLLVHHPLLMSPVSSVAATTAKGRLLHRLIGGGTALLTAHTNADVPPGGVNEALAQAVGILDARVLAPTDEPGLDKLTVFVPADAAGRVRDAVTAAGAGALGAYDSCTFSAAGEGRFRPLTGADPAVGAIGRLEVVPEVRVETVLPRARRAAVVDALRAAHPYEEPAFDVVTLAALPGGPVTGPPPAPERGHGRIGRLAEPTTLRGFAQAVAAALPATAHGVRVSGDPDQPVVTVAVGAGSGEALLDVVRRTEADVLLTSDLKHHRTSEFREDGGCAVVDVAHWAAEWTWLPVVARRLQAAATVDVRVSTVVTDPWTFRA